MIAFVCRVLMGIFRQLVHSGPTTAGVAAMLVLAACSLVFGQTCGYHEFVSGEALEYYGITGGTHHYFRVAGYGSRWNVVAVRKYDGDVDPDLQMWPSWSGVWPDCISGGLLEDSVYTSSHVDYIVIDYNQLSAGSDFFFESWASGGSSGGWYRISFEADQSELIVGETVVYRNVNPSTFVAEIWDVPLVAGTTYEFTVLTSGTALEMALFRPTSGPTDAWKCRMEAEWDATSTCEYTAPVTGRYGLVVYNEDAGGGTFELGPVHNTPVEPTHWGTIKALFR